MMRVLLLFITIKLFSYRRNFFALNSLRYNYMILFIKNVLEFEGCAINNKIMLTLIKTKTKTISLLKSVIHC